ncbi:hypothetical protein [Bernardetia litoralis]|uniref:hypothetical protein n=1 Tax=Bernardetia litoralis TaxID=999 RepID=UPI0002E0611C|nr:hypothetical protein [Bernardetia litoralis]
MFSFLASCSSQSEYCNERFEYCLNYPAAFEPFGSSKSGDGQIFYIDGGKIELLVWGSVNGQKRTLEQEKQYISQNRTVEYQTIKSKFFVISGFENGKVFYLRTEKTQNGFRSFEIRYPKEEKETYDKFVEKINFQEKK